MTQADHDLVVRTIREHAAALLRTARRHSLCADDAHDAYQRALEVFVKRAGTLRAETLVNWLHTVIKHEAMAVRRQRQALVDREEPDLDGHEHADAPTADERVASFDQMTRAAEALQRLKPHEVTALWMKAQDHSYKEIVEANRWSYTNIYRCITESHRASDIGSRPVRRLTAFQARVGLIALVALGVRVIYAIVERHYQVLGDAMTFHQVGQHLADGSGFIQPFSLTGQPTAEHPPAYEVFLAALDLLGGNGYLSHRIAGGLVGTGTVVMIALLGRAIAGEAVGLAAGAVAAVYPMLWTADASLMSETLYGFFLLATLLAAVRMRERPTPWRAAAVGALLGLAALTRGEALGLLVLLVAPLAWLGAPSWRGRVALGAAALAALALVIAPWTIRNLSTFDDPVLISSNASGLFVGANCPDTYHGDLIGSWRFQCYQAHKPGEDESTYFARMRNAGLHYAHEHVGRMPVVMLARLGRLFDVYRVRQSWYINSVEGRPAGPIRWAIRAWWLVGLLGIAGLAILVRRRARGLLVLVAPILLVMAVAVVTYGGTRFRYAAEPSFVVLAAVALGEIGRRIQTVSPWRRDRGSTRATAA